MHIKRAWIPVQLTKLISIASARIPNPSLENQVEL